MGTIEITEQNYLSLRKAYRKAIERNEEDMVWQGHELLTSYVKYVLEYMEMQPIITEAVKAEPDPEEDE